jgi:hypothetical protein
MFRQLKNVTFIFILLVCLLSHAEAKVDFEKLSDHNYKLPKTEAIDTTIAFTSLDDTTVIDPSIVLDIWDGESKFKIIFKSNSAKINYDKDKPEEKKLSWEIKTDQLLDIEAIETNGTNFNGGFIFNLTLSKKPKDNIFSFPVEIENLNYYYQPALTPDEIAQGYIRPENVIGSYAFYHTTKRNNKYKTGKAFHIYRPRIIERDGNWIWGNLSIDGEYLTVTIDEEWLNNATYPVIVDPTIGYTSAGGSGASISHLARSTFPITATESGTFTSVSAYLWKHPGYTADITFNVYNWAEKCPVDSTGTETVSDSPYTSDTWVTLNFTSSPEIVSGQQYAPTVWSDDYCIFYYDSSDSTGFISHGGDKWACPASTTTSTDKYSIYATYDPALTTGTHLYYNSTTPLTNSVDATGVVTYGFNESTSTNTTDTITTDGTTVITINAYNNSSPIARKLTFTGDDITSYTCNGLVENQRYNLTYTNYSTIESSYASSNSITFTTHISAGTYFIRTPQKYSIITLNQSTSYANYPVFVNVTALPPQQQAVMAVDGSDSYFQSTTGTIYPHYFQNITATTAEIWIKVIDNGTDTLNWFYGDGASHPTSTSNGLNVFLYFDDFEAESVNDTYWTLDGNWNAPHWALTSTSAGQGSHSLYSNTMPADSRYRDIRKDVTTMTDIDTVVEWKWKVDSEAYDHFYFGDQNKTLVWSISKSNAIYYIAGTSVPYTTNTGYTGGWQDMRYTLSKTSDSIRWRYAEDVSVSEGLNTGFLDYIKVRPYITPEPVLSTITYVDTTDIYTPTPTATTPTSTSTNYKGGGQKSSAWKNESTIPELVLVPEYVKNQSYNELLLTASDQIKSFTKGIQDFFSSQQQTDPTNSNIFWSCVTVLGVVMFIDGTVFHLDKKRVLPVFKLNYKLLVLSGLFLIMLGLHYLKLISIVI